MMPEPRASADLSKLRALVFQDGWKMESIHQNWTTEKVTSTLTLKKDGQQADFVSNEEDVWFFLATHRPLPDRNGELKMVQTDTSKYYADMEHFVDMDGAKLRRALEHTRRTGAPETKGGEEIFRRVVLSNQRKPGDIEFLFQHHFTITAAFLIQSTHAIEVLKNLHAVLPDTEKYREIVEKALSKSLSKEMRSNSIGAFQTFSSWINLEREQRRIGDQARHHGTVMKLLSIVGQLPGDEAAPFLLDLTRRSLELCRPFFRALLSGLSHEGAAAIDLDCGFEDEVAQLKKFGLEALVAHVDPKIRNSEAHIDSEVRHAERKVIVRSCAGTAEYGYQEIAETLKVLSKGVV